MAEVSYAWGTERPAQRRARLVRQNEAAAAAYQQMLADQAKARQLFEAVIAVRAADLDEVDFMTHGGTSSYDRSLEAAPQVADRVRAENTQAVYGRGARLIRSSLPTQIIPVADDAIEIRKGVKAKGKARSASVAPRARRRRSASEGEEAPVSSIGAVTAAAEPAPPPVLEPIPVSAAVARSVDALVSEGDLSADDPIELGTITDKVLDVFSREAEAEVAKRFDAARLPAGYDPAWADAWPEDPNVPVPEMVREFVSFGAPIDTRPEDLTDAEARFLAGPSIWPVLTPEILKGVRPGVVPWQYTREGDTDDARWVPELKRGGGTYQKLVASRKMYIDAIRDEERVRRKMWPYALQRRKFIKSLMYRLAVGELTFEPLSRSEADMARSVRGRVFRSADHNWLQQQPRYDLHLYYQRILDRLPWPPGLSRVELLADFGAGCRRRRSRTTRPMAVRRSGSSRITSGSTVRSSGSWTPRVHRSMSGTSRSRWSTTSACPT